MDTTTTPAPRASWCPHEEFTSKVDVARHGQTTNGVTHFTFTANLEVWCKQCGRRMVFRCPQGHNHEVSGIPMIVQEDGMETVR